MESIENDINSKVSSGLMGDTRRNIWDNVTNAANAIFYDDIYAAFKSNIKIEIHQKISQIMPWRTPPKVFK